MKRRGWTIPPLMILVAVVSACSPRVDDRGAQFSPTEVIDLGAVVTPDLPQRVWGKGFMQRDASGVVLTSYHHTMGDSIDHVSAKSMKIVGDVAVALLR